MHGEPDFRVGLHLINRLGGEPQTPDFARLLTRDGQIQRAAELLGLAISHPGISSDLKEEAFPFLAELEARPDRETILLAVKRGETLDLEATVQALLAENALYDLEEPPAEKSEAAQSA
jgi:hypothetical protein